ncbi:MAG TPA: hypothetical protein VG435_19790 [Acidimicrobiales bacterium]|jgi:hypothetical protein|nr:hypothetical protein [Acidimicrobiales bacterium]
MMALSGCTSAHRSARPAPTTSLPAGTITADRWDPPVLSGPPGRSNFCAALVAIYRHEGELGHVISHPVATDIIDDYVAYAPTLISQAPTQIRTTVAEYIQAVAGYLHQVVAAGLDLNRLQPGSLTAMSSAGASNGYKVLSTYSQTNCHYTIGGS